MASPPWSAVALPIARPRSSLASEALRDKTDGHIVLALRGYFETAAPSNVICCRGPLPA